MCNLYLTLDLIGKVLHDTVTDHDEVLLREHVVDQTLLCLQLKSHELALSSSLYIFLHLSDVEHFHSDEFIIIVGAEHEGVACSDLP